MEIQLRAFDLARSFCSITDIDTLLTHISLAVEQLTKSEAASILLLDQSKKQLVFRTATGEKGSSMKKFYVPVGKGIAGWVAQEGKPLIINDVQADTRFTGQIDKSSGFASKSILAIPLKVEGELIGVCEVLNKTQGVYTEEDQKVLESLGALAAITIHNARMAEDNRNFFSHMIEIIITAIEGADLSLTGHSYRVADLACQIGRQLGMAGDEYKNLYYGALLHDIGQLSLHDLRVLPNVLSQAMERTPEKLHPLVGAELLKDIRLLAPIAPIIRHHHEYVDGTGHPFGLVGADIPLASRVICLVEAIDDLHMKGLAGEEYQKEAIRIAQEGSGIKFDKDVVDAYLALAQSLPESADIQPAA